MGDLWGRMGDLWGIYGGVWGIYGGLVGNLWGYKSLVWIGPVLCMGLRRLTYGDLWGCCGCGVKPMGVCVGAVAAVRDLWGSMGLLWLRCGTYGADLWG